MTTTPLWVPPRFTLGCDLDGVLYRLTPVMRDWLHDQCGIPYTQMPDPLTYRLEDVWRLDRGFFLDQMIAAVRAGVLFHQGGAFADGVAAVNRIAAAGHWIRMITARNLPGAESECRAATVTWLAQEQVHYDDLVLTHRKTEAHFDLLVDDFPDNVEEALDAGRCAALLDQPWNRYADHLPRVTWPQVPAIVDEMERVMAGGGGAALPPFVLPAAA